MSLLQKIGAAVLLALLAVTGYGLWRTRQPDLTPVALTSAPAAQPAATNALPVIDQRTLLIAQRLAPHATTPEEVPLAQAAVQLADHELDLAFAGALRHLETHPPVLSPQAQQIQDQVNAAQRKLDSDSARVKDLTDALAKAPNALKASIQDQLDLAQAQQQLDQDEVTQANDALLNAGGNLHQRIQLMQQEHETAAKSRPATSAVQADPLGGLKGLVGKVREYLALVKKATWLGKAQGLAAASVAQLSTERAQMAAALAASRQRAAAATAGEAPAGTAPASQPAPAGGAGSGAAAAPTLLTLTREVAAEQNYLSIRDERIAARQKLADTYGAWVSVVAGQASAILHTCLIDAAVVLGALLLLLFIDTWLEHLLGRTRLDRRQLATLRSVIGVSLQIAGVVLILVVLIGVPGQLGTMLGLAGAGLTVALKDFLVAFVGWFVLMGKNGVRLGDWVEINGVSGEVVDLGMFHTVLLETGNWTDAGHPTGRRVTFTNSFAIEGHYFNFSTSGQWLWDELSVTVPFDRDSGRIAQAIEKEVADATADNARQAEQEWRRAARGQRGSGISAVPGVAVRPAGGGVAGVEIAVRYVTRASERYALRARLYQTVVGLLAQHPAAAA
jgi:small-conductance mechanosensitive channel